MKTGKAGFEPCFFFFSNVSICSTHWYLGEILVAVKYVYFGTQLLQLSFYAMLVLCLRFSRLQLTKMYPPNAPQSPYKKIDGMYDIEAKKKYRNGVDKDTVPPHIFAIADNAFEALKKDLKNQVGRLMAHCRWHDLHPSSGSQRIEMGYDREMMVMDKQIR